MEPISELEKIKTEILDGLSLNKKSKRRLKFGSSMVSAVLVVLTVFSVIQAVQSATIYSKVKGGAVIKAAGAANSPSPNNNALPGNVQNLPNMVGGC